MNVLLPPLRPHLRVEQALTLIDSLQQYGVPQATIDELRAHVLYATTQEALRTHELLQALAQLCDP